MRSSRTAAGDLDSLPAPYVQDDKDARLSATKTVSAMAAGREAILDPEHMEIESVPAE